MRGQALRLDHLQSNNPQQFWLEINKLGPPRIKKIPMEIILDNGETENKKEVVLGRWEKGFGDLFSGSHIPPGFDDTFLKEACAIKCSREIAMNHPVYCSNEFLNHDISLDEVKLTISKAKLNKAMGIEGIPNEALKSPHLLNTLYHLFKTCFNHIIIP